MHEYRTLEEQRYVAALRRGYRPLREIALEDLLDELSPGPMPG